MENVAKPQVAETIKTPHKVTKSVTIALASDIVTRSMFRRVNSKVMDERMDYIGSSIGAVNTLLAGDEMSKYMPQIIGHNAAASDFLERCKLYFNNITVKVTGDGVKLDTSFIYDSYDIAEKFANNEAAIEAEFEKVNKADSKAFKDALDSKVRSLHALESMKYKYGSPINIKDYILYRYCLLYPMVAKDLSIVASNPNIRFYVKDEDKERARAEKQYQIGLKAMSEFVKLSGEADKFAQVFVIVAKKESWIGYELFGSMERQMKLKAYSESNPAKFLKIAQDKNLQTTYLIESLIDSGELQRVEYSQNIITSDGEFIGANMIETTAWFNNDLNAGRVAAWKKKLNL